MSIASVVLSILTGICGALLNLASGGAALTAVFAYMAFGMSAMVMVLWWAWLRHTDTLRPMLRKY